MQGNPAYRFVVRRGPQPNQVYEITEEVSNLGRDITNDIVINDREVSRHHLRIMRGTDNFTIEDLGSTNGTFVNGKRITGAVQLKNGDMVGLGETVTLQFEVARPGEAPSPPAEAAPQQTVQSSSDIESDEDRFKPKPREEAPAPQANPYQAADQPVSQAQPEPEFLQQQQAVAEPAYPQQEYSSQQSNDYAAAYGPPPPGYDYDPYDVRGEDSGGAMQWLIIAFLGVLVLCCCLTVFLAVAIDTFCLYDSIPGLTGLLNGFGLTPNC